jgi:hypothetical protein
MVIFSNARVSTIVTKSQGIQKNRVIREMRLIKGRRYNSRN